MERKYLADTNTIIDFCNGKLPVNGKELLMQIEIEISVITHIELFSSNNILESELKLLKKIVELLKIHPVVYEIVDTTISIRKNHKIKLADAIIAATSIFYDLPLISRNTSDFKKIPGLVLINPYEL